MRTVVCTCNGELRRRDGDVKLVENVVGSCDGVLELSGGFRWVRLPRVLSTLKMYTKTVTASASGWNGDGKRSLFRATRVMRPGVVIVARTCKSKYVPHITFLFA